MPALNGTKHNGEIVWLGLVPEDVAEGSIRSQSRDRLTLDFGGTVGEHHHGETRASCVRVTDLYPQGTQIRNTRQLSVLAQEELDTIAAQMGLEQIDPVQMGASIVIRGIPDFSHVPPSSRLQAPNGTTLTVDMENRPCIWPGRMIEADHPGYGKAFKPAAAGRRGVTAWVERPGTLAIGDNLRLFVPDQPAWAP